MAARSSSWPGAVLVGALALAACGDASPSATSGEPIDVHLGQVVDAAGEGSTTLELSLASSPTVRIHLDGEARVVEIDAAGRVSTATLLSADGSLDEGQAYAGGIWQRPRPLRDESVTLQMRGSEQASLTISARGAPPALVKRERSLVWTDPDILDDPSQVGLARVLAAASDDGHGGVLLDRWFRRFATTLHSERAAPAQLMDEIAGEQGSDPSAWDLDALPFMVTAVHNRHDLGPRGGGCGELRVSLASTHPVVAPLHLIFLFRQEPRADDLGPDGEPHCLGTARRWTRLSELDHAAFVAAAGAWLDETLVHDRFLLAESVELTVSPWEWRQWAPVGTDELDNPPLFQTVATPLLNQPGSLRDDFLSWVAAHADELSRRSIEIPASYRLASAQAPPSIPRETLDLSGLDPATTAAFPELAHRIEIVGCPTCHTDDANFVHTTVQRTFSPFYDRELDARADRIDALNRGELQPLPPFGPLQ